MCIDELHKFSDGTLNDVQTALNDRLKGIRIKYLLQTIWRQSDRDKAGAMIQFDESDTHVLERFDTSAGNPVKEILPKLNLPDHRILKDRGEDKESQERCNIKAFQDNISRKVTNIAQKEKTKQNGQNRAREWKEREKLEILSMSPELQRQFENYASYDMLQELKSVFEKQAGVERFMRNYNMQNIGKTIGELHALLIEYEKVAKGKGKGQGNGKSKLAYAPKPINPSHVKKEHEAKDAAYHHCKEVSHWRRNCHVYLAELMKKNKQAGYASTSCIFTIKLFYFLNKSWVYDTTHGLRGERKLK
ncbi:hypothetical protein Tco_0782876 [Tanacetum coccineum]